MERRDSSTGNREIPTINRPWQEIRDFYAQNNYSVLAEETLAKIKQWKSEPKTYVRTVEWHQQIKEQIQKALSIPSNSKYDEAQIADTRTKIYCSGLQRPEIGKSILTRLYIGLDPRKAADAFISIIDQLKKQGVLKDLDIALNMENLYGENVAGNTIIIYEPSSRPTVLDKILASYRQARAENPELFALTAKQKAEIARGNLLQLKGIIDANLSFVEMAEEEAKSFSYDFHVAADIKTVFVGKEHPGDNEWLARLKSSEIDGAFIPTFSSIKRLEDKQIKLGDTLAYKRKANAPFLVQKGRTTLTKPVLQSILPLLSPFSRLFRMP